VAAGHDRRQVSSANGESGSPCGLPKKLTSVSLAQESGLPAGSPPSESLPRARIIRRRTVFDAARNKGRRVTNRWMALNFLPCDAIKPGETGTVAFLTPKRVGAATKRTQLRRRMREIYRRHLAQCDETLYLIWVARPVALELPFEELKKCMTALRERVKT
jgi:ribonuclease P protein component